MKRSTLFFFFGLIAMVALIARCNSRSRLAEQSRQSTSPSSPLVPSIAPSSATKPSVSATSTAQPTKSPAADLAKAAAQIQPAVVSISVFEPSGKLLRTGSGVFVSTNGKILTTRSLMENGAHAIAKTADNRIHNVSGILTDIESDDLAVLGMETKDQVPFIAPNASVTADEGTRVAVVQSPLGREKISVIEASISKKHRDQGTEWLELSAQVGQNAMGAPVVNGHGEVVGLVTRGPGDTPVVVRTASMLNAIVARIPADGRSKWFAEETPPSPAEGPRKVPLAQNPQGRKSKLIYSPAPAYPSSARSSSGAVKGTGRFRLSFDANGQVKNIVILRSTQNGALDQAAVEALRHWKATPGGEWELNVPITFQ
jgi:TonB family protein